MVGYLGAVPQEFCDKALRAASRVAERLGREGATRGDVLVLVAPVEELGAMVMHRDERVVPQPVRDFAARHGARYVIATGTGLLGWEPELVEAVLAHELGHIVLGHCDGRVMRCLSQFSLFRKLCLGHELAADAFAARLGRGEALAEALRRFRAASRVPFGGIRTAVRLWNLRRILGRPGLVSAVCISEGQLNQNRRCRH
ncbi:MAG: M48 family metalloprotease [Moorellales bacterium]